MLPLKMKVLLLGAMAAIVSIHLCSWVPVPAASLSNSQKVLQLVLLFRPLLRVPPIGMCYYCSFQESCQ